MLRYITSRLLYTLPVIWLVVSVVFLMIHLVPGDPIAMMLGEGAPAADLEAARHAYGLDVPVGQQYVNYWRGVFHGDLGKSLRFNQSVTSLLVSRYPFTMKLTFAALAAYLWAIGVERPLINAVVPTAGFMLSTLTMPLARRAWLGRREKLSGGGGQ